MSIYRVEKNRNYTVMNRTALNDKRLSWKAKGIIAYMLSLPDDWKFYIEELVTHSSDGKASFRSGLEELKKCGYVQRNPVREGNRITSWETVIHEIPLDTDFQEVESLEVESVEVENQPLLSTDSLLNTDIIIPFSEIISHLNEKTKSNYKSKSKKTRDLIKARWIDGFRLDDFKTVIDKKASEWLKDNEMCKYLRPETLFGTKFESYLNQKVRKSRVRKEDFNLEDPQEGESMLTGFG
jgi:uncharacterized phage protein (TIGR02220 family)